MITVTNRSSLIAALKFEAKRFSAMALLEERYSLHANVMTAAATALESAEKEKSEGAA